MTPAIATLATVAPAKAMSMSKFGQKAARSASQGFRSFNSKMGEGGRGFKPKAPPRANVDNKEQKQIATVQRIQLPPPPKRLPPPT